MTESTRNQGAADACRDLFGASPEGVIAPIHGAAETLIWLHEILQTIARDALDSRHGYRVKALAEAGAYLATDAGNTADCQFEALAGRLREAGVMGDVPA